MTSEMAVWEAWQEVGCFAWMGVMSKVKLLVMELPSATHYPPSCCQVASQVRDGYPLPPFGAFIGAPAR